MNTLEQKLGLKAGLRLIIINAPEPAPVLVLDGIELSNQLRGEFDIIIAFSAGAKTLDRNFVKWKMHVPPDGRLWIAWPKKSGMETDLNIKEVIRIGYEHGMVESNAISLNDAWSALKFTHPKAGKEYHNSYGTLNEAAVRHYRK